MKLRLLSLAASLACAGLAHAAPGDAPFPAAIAPLSAEQRAIFLGSPADTMPEKLEHVQHYLSSNEFRQDLFRASIADLGGGYVGVGSDQSLMLLPWQKAELAWLIDYDDAVVEVNRVHWKLLAAAPTVEEFLALWSPEERARAEQVLAEGASPADLRALKRALRDGRPGFLGRVRGLRRKIEEVPIQCYLNDPIQYGYLHRMARAGRVRALNGNLLGDQALAGIAASARKLGVPVRVVYMSNAEQYFRYTPSFRRNLSRLPYDERSVILRTFPIRPIQKSRYLYNVEPASNLVAWLERSSTQYVMRLLRYRDPYRLREDLQEELTRLDRLPTDDPPRPLPSPVPPAPPDDKQGRRPRKPGKTAEARQARQLR